MSGILYISYSGMLEPLGQSQVLAYLERLSKHFDVHLISFEKPGGDASAWAEVRARMAKAGIDWHPLRYHRRPSALATAYDIAQGIRLGRALIKRHKLQLVHARSYIPSVMALALKKRLGVRYLFDMRGFWPDERVDGGLWPRNGRMYRLVKKLERKFLLGADAIVSLTHAAAAELRAMPVFTHRTPPIHVIPTCADLQRFTPAAARAEGPFTLGYVGTVGNWYKFDETVDYFSLLRERLPGAKLLVVNRGEHEQVRALLAAKGVDPTATQIAAASHSEMPSYIRQMSAGILIAKPAYSHIARAPTRLAEFLGCGIPCLANDGVGDVTRILEGEQVGIIARGADRESRAKALDALIALAADPGIASRCVDVARRLFSVEDGSADYRDIYLSLGVSPKPRPAGAD